jgi:hypothetical protein
VILGNSPPKIIVDKFKLWDHAVRQRAMQCAQRPRVGHRSRGTACGTSKQAPTKRIRRRN